MFERTTPKVSIVIPNWFTPGMDGRHGKDETFVVADKCMERLMEIRPDGTELIMIDNGSTLAENDCAGVSNYWKRADILIKNPVNLGYAPAVNQGVNLARGEFVLILNNDIFAWENFVEDLLEVFDHKEFTPPVGIAMPNLIKKECQKDCLTDSGKLDVYKVMRLRKDEIIYPSKDRYEIGAEFGSALMMRKNLIDKIREINKGEFLSEKYQAGFGEDRQLYCQVRQCGFQTYRTNKIRCLHVGNLTMSKIKDRKEYTLKNREKLAKWKEENNIK